MNQNTMKLFSGLLLLSMVVLVSSCSKDPESRGYEYMPDMYRSPSYKTYEVNALFADSLSAPVNSLLHHLIQVEYHHVVEICVTLPTVKFTIQLLMESI